MRLLRDLQLSGLLGDLAALAQPQPALALAPSETLAQTCAPAGEAGAFVLRRLAAAGHVVAGLCLATRKAAAALSGQFAHSFFMPLCLTGLAILARIQARRLPLCARNAPLCYTGSPIFQSMLQPVQRPPSCWVSAHVSDCPNYKEDSRSN